MKIGENIKRFRIKKGMTQAELAQKIGITQTMIGHIERGAKVPSLIVALDIAEVLECTVEEMCKEETQCKTA